MEGLNADGSIKCPHCGQKASLTGPATLPSQVPIFSCYSCRGGSRTDYHLDTELGWEANRRAVGLSRANARAWR